MAVDRHRVVHPSNHVQESGQIFSRASKLGVDGQRFTIGGLRFFHAPGLSMKRGEPTMWFRAIRAQ